MEIALLIGFSVVAYFIFIGARFTNFKSRLMNEFGKLGLPFKDADIIYYKNSNTIHELHHDGMPIDQIARKFGAPAIRKDEPKPINTITGPSDRQENKKESYLREIASQFIVVQLALSSGLVKSAEDLFFEDGFARGYLFGFADMASQQLFTPSERAGKGLAFIFSVYQDLCSDFAPELLKLSLDAQHSEAFTQGRGAGAHEMGEWLKEKVQPWGLRNHLYQTKQGD